MFTRRRVGLVFALLVALPCAPYARTNPQPEPKPASVFYEDGLTRMNTGDAAGAIIQLKNALQQDPNHLPARIALGAANLRSGDAAAAEKELRIALGLGAARDQVYPVLGNALLAQRKFSDILDTIKSGDPASDGGFEIVLLRGRASYELGRLRSAGEAYEKARALGPKRSEPLVGLAQIAAAQSRLPEALGLTEQATALAPKDTEAWYRKGEVLRQLGRDDEALAALDQAAATNPKALRVRLARAALHLQYGRLPEARNDIDFVREASPDNIAAAFLDWQINDASGDHKAAKANLREVIGQLNLYTDEAVNSEPLLLRIAALTRYANRDLVRTSQYLARYVELQPNDLGMQRLNGQVLLLLGDAQAAIESLYPLYRQDPTNRDVMIALGQAYLQIGHYKEAEGMFLAAQALAPDDASLATRIALSRLGTGAVDDALTGLATGVESDKPGRDGAALLLAVLQIKARNYADATKTVAGVLERHPNDPRSLNLYGIALSASGDLNGAREIFGRAAAAPDFLPPIYNLAKLDLADDDVASATKRLETAVERNPQSDAALLALADIASQHGDTAQAIRWLSRAVNAAPDAVAAQARLVEMHLTLGQTSEAHAAATRLLDHNPENALAVETMANVDTALGKRPQAMKNYRDAARYASYDGAMLMRIARQQVELGDFAEARRTLVKATNTAVSDEAVTTLIRLEIATGEYEHATERISTMRRDPISEALADVLSGELALARNLVEQAIAAFTRAQERLPSTQGVLGLADSYTSAGDFDQGAKVLEAWAARYPNDRVAKQRLAFIYLPAGRLDEAKALHEELLKGDPDNPLLLANLARLYQLRDDPRARETAVRALELAPKSPMTLDTLGWILVTQKETLRGLELLREAIARENNPLIRFHLAQALSELGRVDEAKAELKQIISAGRPPDLVQEVQRYYDKLVAAR
jgi:putative PEP-CTERM system TPR-repeat lipoprotein